MGFILFIFLDWVFNCSPALCALSVVLPRDSLTQHFHASPSDSCWFSNLQAPIAIVILFKVFLRKKFPCPVYLFFFILLTFLFLYPLCSMSVSKGICLLTHLSGARGRCGTWLWWRHFMTCRSNATSPETTVTSGSEYCRPLFGLGKEQLAS